MLHQTDVQRRLMTTLVLFGCLVPTSWSVGKPLSGRAAKHLPTLANLAKKPSSERRLSEAEVERFLRFTEGDDGHLKLVSVLALAYATDPASDARLREIEAKDHKRISGAAAYALRSRELVGKESNEQLRLLRLSLKESSNPFARLFLANRTAVDFGDAAVPVIVEAMKVERNDMVKCDMLYYVVTGSVLPDSAREVLDLKWNTPVWLPEDLAYVMRSLTPGRSNDPAHNSTTSLLSELRARETEARSKGD